MARDCPEEESVKKVTVYAWSNGSNLVFSVKAPCMTCSICGEGKPCQNTSFDVVVCKNILGLKKGKVAVVTLTPKAVK